MMKWDFTKLSTNQYETNEHTVTEAFQGISVHTNTADIIFARTEEDACSVVCFERSNEKHSVSVKDGTLVIEISDTRKWYEHIGIGFKTPQITVYLPRNEYDTLTVKSDTGDVTCYASVSETLKIKATTGDILLSNLSVGSLELSVSTGKIKASGVTCEGDVSVRVSTGKTNLTDMTCKSLITKGSTGDLSLKNVVASGSFSIERSTGDVTFDGSDAAEIFVKTDTGDVEGSLLSSKVFMVTTDTGDKDVPKTVSGGRCEIATDTGDIRIRIQ